MDAADPLCAISPALLLPRKFGPIPANATGLSLSKVRVEAIAPARSLKGSEELVKQAKMVLNEHGDIQAIYHDDGVKARPNGSKEQQGRRPALDRKRARFTMKDTGSKPVPVVDRSKLSNIPDPVEFFMTLDRLEEAEEEIKRLNGEAEKRVLNFDPVDEHTRRPGLPGRKSVRSFKIIEDAGTQDPVEVPASRTETIIESRSQDVMHAAADKNEQSAPSISGEAISVVSGKEDSLAQKDGRDDLTYLLTSLQDLDESEEEVIRKTLGIKEIRKGRVSLRNSIPGVRSLRSNTEQKGSMKVRCPESPLSQSRQDRISELEKHLFPGGAKNAKCTDDESEGSPDIVMDEPSLVQDSSDVQMTDENFTGSQIDRETPNLGARAVDQFLDPQANLPDDAYERQPGGSSLGLYRDTEVPKENEACSRSNISVEEFDVPIDCPTIGRSTNETEVSYSQHLEGSLTEELVSKPDRNVAPDGIDRTSHTAEDSIQHLELVKEGDVLQDKSSQSLEMPPEDVDPLNQPQLHGGSPKKLAPDLCNALSPTKQKKQQAAQVGKRKQQSKKGKKVADESSHALEIPQANFDLENQPHNDDVNIEQQTIMSSALSPNDAKGQKGAQRRNKTKNLNQRKILEDAAKSGVRRSTRTRSRPLEHWLGERLLYGPIDDTLPAVLGIKVYSPGQDGKRTLKVKSFVSEQYSDLVAKSAK